MGPGINRDGWEGCVDIFCAGLLLICGTIYFLVNHCCQVTKHKAIAEDRSFFDIMLLLTCASARREVTDGAMSR